MSITCTFQKAIGLVAAVQQQQKKKADLKPSARVQHSRKSKHFSPNTLARISKRNVFCHGASRGNSGEGPHATLNSTFVETEESLPLTYIDEPERENEAMWSKTHPDEEFGTEEEIHRV